MPVQVKVHRLAVFPVPRDNLFTGRHTRFPVQCIKPAPRMCVRLCRLSELFVVFGNRQPDSGDRGGSLAALQLGEDGFPGCRIGNLGVSVYHDEFDGDHVVAHFGPGGQGPGVLP